MSFFLLLAWGCGDAGASGDNESSVANNGPGRSSQAAKNQAKRDAGIPRSQNPYYVNYAEPTNKNNNKISGMAPMRQEWYHTDKYPTGVILQQHPDGHPNLDPNTAPHWHARPASNPRHGVLVDPYTQQKLPGHYYYGKGTAPEHTRPSRTGRTAPPPPTCAWDRHNPACGPGGGGGGFGGAGIGPVKV